MEKCPKKTCSWRLCGIPAWRGLQLLKRVLLWLPAACLQSYRKGLGKAHCPGSTATLSAATTAFSTEEDLSHYSTAQSLSYLSKVFRHVLDCVWLIPPTSGTSVKKSHGRPSSATLTNLTEAFACCKSQCNNKTNTNVNINVQSGPRYVKELCGWAITSVLTEPRCCS